MASQMEQGIQNIGQVFKSVPAKALNVTSRRMLSKHLNPHKIGIENDRAMDWEGLAECCGFDYLDIQNFRERQDPTKCVLDEWSSQKSSTLGILAGFLEELGRWDVLEDETLYNAIGAFCHLIFSIYILCI